LEGLVMEDVSIFYGQLVIFLPTGKVYGQLLYFMVNFFTFWYVVSRKIWQPCSRSNAFFCCLSVHYYFLFQTKKSFFTTFTLFRAKLQFQSAIPNANGWCLNGSLARLPDFSWHNIGTKNGSKFTKLQQIFSKNHKIYQMAIIFSK
jgi:hypothetical protein